MGRYFPISRACSRKQVVSYLTLTMVACLVLVMKQLLSNLMSTDTTFVEQVSLTKFNESSQQFHHTEILDPVLIFTCLGALAFIKHQTYIWHALNQARVINPHMKIVVILSRSALKTSIKQKLQVLNISLEINEDLVYNNSLVKDFHRVFFVQGSMEPNGNYEFVQFTLERLLSIYAYMDKTGQAHVFHMENDNMLYIDLRQLGKRMNNCEVNLAVPKAAKNQAVISFMYIRDLHVLEHFVKWCLNVFRLGRKGAINFLNTTFINDMTLTARYLELRGATEEQSKRSGVYELPTQFVDEHRECCLCFLEHNPLIFDACVLGQYFGGTYGKPNESYWELGRLVDPRGTKLLWKSLSKHIKVPYIKNCRIANIHVHSKRLDQFSSIGNDQTIGFVNVKN